MPARTKLQQSEEVNRHAPAAQKAAADLGDRPLKAPLLSSTTKPPLPACDAYAGSGGRYSPAEGTAEEQRGRMRALRAAVPFQRDVSTSRAKCMPQAELEAWDAEQSKLSMALIGSTPINEVLQPDAVEYERLHKGEPIRIGAGLDQLERDRQRKEIMCAAQLGEIVEPGDPIPDGRCTLYSSRAQHDDSSNGFHMTETAESACKGEMTYLGTLRGKRSFMTTCSPADASKHPVDFRLVYLLAQAMVLEADFDAPDDHAALGYTLVRGAKAQGIRLVDHILHYVAGFKVNTPRTRWVRELPFNTADKPEHWPPNARWSKSAWDAVKERAYGVLIGTLPDPTPGATHYGARNLPADVARAERAVKAGRWIPARVARGAKLLQNYYVQRAPRRRVPR